MEAIAVLCLTTTLASLFALGVTLTTWLSPRSWYATLIVTAVPFLIGIVAVLLVRSGWTALSTGVTFALALTLVTTRRAGMTPLLRSAAAALLVPALAVVVVCLGAQLLPMSGSPIVLPVIAAIVACTLPAAAVIAAALKRRGIPAAEADAARRWIEISVLVTAVLSVVARPGAHGGRLGHHVPGAGHPRCGCRRHRLHHAPAICLVGGRGELDRRALVRLGDSGCRHRSNRICCPRPSPL